MTTVPPAERSASPAQHGRERDLTTGSVAGHVRALAIPSALSLLFITVYNVTDTLFAGQVSTEAQAGLGLGSQLFFLVTALGVGFRIGASAVVGQLLGAGDHEGAARAATQVLSASIVVTVGVMVAGYFGFDPLVDWIAGGQAYGEAAKQYVDILLLASPGFVVAYALSGVQAAMGDAETLARAQFASSMLNVGLNPLLVFGVPGVLDGMGLAGIAWATLLCQTGVLVYILRTSLRSSVFRAFEMGHLRPDLPMLGELSQQVVPGTARLLVIVVGGVLAQIFLEPFGEDAVAAYNVGLRLEQLLLLPAIGVTSAVLPFVSQNMGAGRTDRVREGFWLSVIVGSAIMALGAVGVWTLGRPVVGLFGAGAGAEELAMDYLKVVSVGWPLFGLLFGLQNLLQGLKRPLAPLLVGTWRQGFAMAVFGWLFVQVLAWGPHGVWAAVLAGMITGTLMMVAATAWVLRGEDLRLVG